MPGAAPPGATLGLGARCSRGVPSEEGAEEGAAEEEGAEEGAGSEEGAEEGAAEEEGAEEGAGAFGRPAEWAGIATAATGSSDAVVDVGLRKEGV